MSAILPLVVPALKVVPNAVSRASRLRVFLRPLTYARLALRCALPQQRNTDQKELLFRRYPLMWSDHHNECAESNGNSAGNVHQFAKPLIEHSQHQNDSGEYPDHAIHSLLPDTLKPLLANVNRT
jgi:hypothetical protein